MLNELFPGLTSMPDLPPAVVHFPIAFWSAGTGAWLIAAIRRGKGRMGRPQ